MVARLTSKLYQIFPNQIDDVTESPSAENPTNEIESVPVEVQPDSTES